MGEGVLRGPSDVPFRPAKRLSQTFWNARRTAGDPPPGRPFPSDPGTPLGKPAAATTRKRGGRWITRDQLGRAGRIVPSDRVRGRPRHRLRVVGLEVGEPGPRSILKRTRSDHVRIRRLRPSSRPALFRASQERPGSRRPIVRDAARETGPFPSSFGANLPVHPASDDRTLHIPYVVFPSNATPATWRTSPQPVAASPEGIDSAARRCLIQSSAAGSHITAASKHAASPMTAVRPRLRTP